MTKYRLNHVISLFFGLIFIYLIIVGAFFYLTFTFFIWLAVIGFLGLIGKYFQWENHKAVVGRSAIILSVIYLAVGIIGTITMLYSFSQPCDTFRPFGDSQTCDCFGYKLSLNRKRIYNPADDTGSANYCIGVRSNIRI